MTFDQGKHKTMSMETRESSLYTSQTRLEHSWLHFLKKITDTNSSGTMMLMLKPSNSHLCVKEKHKKLPSAGCCLVFFTSAIIRDTSEPILLTHHPPLQCFYTTSSCCSITISLAIACDVNIEPIMQLGK